ncbi:MAG: hypothetical protein LBH97_00715 [Treponema sp.]|jgi:uncharacterized integral membrane protein|nr:hypothetical protein [Treponema sp.]
MPWRLIEFIVVFAVFLVFIMFNLDNKCDINFGFWKVKDAPVFLTAFASFFLGMLCAMPFVLSVQAKRKAKTVKGQKPLQKSMQQPAWKQGTKSGEKPSGEASDLSDGGSYGID